MLIPSYPAIQQEFNIPEALIAIPDAFFVLISAVFALIWGYYTDRINRTKVILAGAFSWTIGMLLTGFSTSYLMIVISRLSSGAGLGCVLPVGYSIISDAIPPDERSGWFGMLAILSSISNGIGQGLSSFLGPILTWRFPFFLLSGISIVVVFMLFFVKIPQRGASESELEALSELNLEYSYRISREDLKQIFMKKTNRFLIIQGFFSIIPGTIFIYFLTSMLTLHQFSELPTEIRLQTASIFAAMVGIGYILGNVILSYVGDVLFRRNKRNRANLATACMFATIPLCLLMLFFITPVDVNALNIDYPDPIPTLEIGNYLFLTIGEIFKVYPVYILYFVFALIGSILASGPVANRNAIMIDANMPEHKGTAASFFNLSEQLGKGFTLLISYLLISFLGSIFNMMVISVFFWLPAGILWYFASRNVKEDMDHKSRILSERKQTTLIDYIFELEIQMDRAKQKVQDSKYYIFSDKGKFNELIQDAITIFEYCERESEFRSITNIGAKAKRMKSDAKTIKEDANAVFKQLDRERLGRAEEDRLNEDLRQIKLRISEWEKSTLGEIQTYYEVAYLKIVEARLLRKSDILESLTKIAEGIYIYERVKYLLKERIENKKEKVDDEELLKKKEQELLEKCNNALMATLKLKKDIKSVIRELKNQGIEKNNLKKISELTTEYALDINEILIETFGQDKKTKKALIKLLEMIDEIFNEYDKWKEAEFKVY
ncbi:MAG: Inner membrane transport protein YdhP [Promethearchaeota archaeon]|nr:MAG: Inner membrane transport protein YdhP [Candidatus Lokiarchaeota archaeon]